MVRIISTQDGHNKSLDYLHILWFLNDLELILDKSIHKVDEKSEEKFRIFFGGDELNLQKP